MKRRMLFSILLLILCLLAGCAAGGNAPATYSLEYEGVTYRVDTQAGTLSDGTHTYTYTFSGNSRSYSVEILYPDGSSYWFRMDAGVGQGGWSDDYDDSRYTDGDTLCEVLRQKAPAPPRDAPPIAVILVMVPIGLFSLLAPQAAWQLEYGWRFKDAEPSDAALVLQRIGGAVVLIVAFILFFA
ncbi:MAG: hypothetical protein IJ518_05365 [Clostridia bacterium]|nr:hypothetical protein [Clostridia bacterium]